MKYLCFLACFSCFLFKMYSQEHEVYAIKKRDSIFIIDKQKNKIVPQYYDDVENINQNFVVTKRNHRYYLILLSLKKEFEISSINHIRLYLDAVIINDDEKLRTYIVDKEGNLGVFTEEYTDFYTLKDGLFRVKKEDKYGYVDTVGKEVIPFIYDDGRDFSEGMAAVRIDKKWGFINKKGENFTEIAYELCGDFEHGRAMVRDLNKMGVIDKNGTLIVPMNYVLLNLDNKGIIVATDMHGEVTIYNNKGKALSEKEIGDYINGVLEVE